MQSEVQSIRGSAIGRTNQTQEIIREK
jgi:hypothetical protein